MSDQCSKHQITGLDLVDGDRLDCPDCEHHRLSEINEALKTQLNELQVAQDSDAVIIGGLNLIIENLQNDIESLADQMENEGPTNRTWYLELRALLEEKVAKIKVRDLKKLKLKIDYRNSKPLHDAIIVKLLNLGFKKKPIKTLKQKPEDMIFVEDGRFYGAFKTWTYAHKFQQVTLDDLYNLNPFLSTDVTITLEDGDEITLSRESTVWKLITEAVEEEQK